MSSSDDDDCYGNIAQRLQSMKQTYKSTALPVNEDNENLNDESLVDDEDGDISLTTFLKKESLKMSLQSNDQATSLESQPSTAMSKRITRNPLGKKKKNSKQKDTIISTPSENVQAPVCPARSPARRRPGANGRRGGRGQLPQSMMDFLNAVHSIENVQAPICPGRNTGRRRPGANRQRGGRGRSSRSWMNNQIPTYSIGNTDEYPDASDGVQLFGQQMAPEGLVDTGDEDFINTSLDDNEDISVKVFWKSSEYVKFSIRKFQKISQIFDFFSEREGISKDQLFFTLGKRVLRSDDTPDSIDYSICKFIEGGIVHYGVTHLTTHVSEKATTGIQLKFQCQQRKKPFITKVDSNQKLYLAMVKCAEDLEVPLSKIKFYFDGDLVDSSATPNQLDLEGGECIDVRILS